MRPFVGKVKRSNLVLVRRKSDSMKFSLFMGPKVTSDLPWWVNEGSDQFGIHGNVVQQVKIYDHVKFHANPTDPLFP